MELSIIIVNFQGLSLLKSCLASVQTHLDGRVEHDVWVVDNASTDGSPEWLRAHAAGNPDIHVILNAANLGFARANNLALRKCEGRFVLLLNSDALLVDDSVLEGMRFLEDHPDAFGVGGLLLNGDGTTGPSYGHFPTPGVLATEVRRRAFSSLRAVVPRDDQGQTTIDFPCGAYFLVASRHLASVGLLDETFFLYFEETDWARRAWNLGHPIHYLPQCRAIHLGGGSSKGPANAAIVGTFYESWRIYLSKHSSLAGTLCVFALLLAVNGWNAARTLARGDTLSSARFRVHIRGLFWGFLGRPSRRLSGAAA